MRLIVSAIFVLLTGSFAAAETRARIAVASNFQDTLRSLSDAFEEKNADSHIDIISGSTGKLYAQIIASAPFDAFFSADSERPSRLEATGKIQAGSRFTYALGILILWTPRDDLNLSTGSTFLQSDRYRRLAIANPRLAPYGQASIEALRQLDALPIAKNRLVYGENVAQAYHFAHSGAAELALVSLAQIQVATSSGGSAWRLPQDTYSAIEQQAVLLTENPVAANFLAFCRSEAGRKLIEKAGYRLP